MYIAKMQICNTTKLLIESCEYTYTGMYGSMT